MIKMIAPPPYNRHMHRIQGKPWIWQEKGIWMCASNLGGLLHPQILLGVGQTPRDAWLSWDTLNAPLS